jgi:hypothetical protein
MRAIFALALLCVLPVTARADSYVGLVGGVAIPMSDDTYTDAVDNSPVIGVRVGANPKSIGGYLSFETMFADVKSDGTFGLDVSAQRFRLIVGPELNHPVSNLLAVTGRAGIGLDIGRNHVEGNVGPIAVDESETDLGFGLEFAGGLWARVGGLQVGGELSLPIGIHDDDSNENNFDYDYTAIDLQILFGVRFVSGSGD